MKCESEADGCDAGAGASVRFTVAAAAAADRNQTTERPAPLPAADYTDRAEIYAGSKKIKPAADFVSFLLAFSRRLLYNKDADGPFAGAFPRRGAKGASESYAGAVCSQQTLQNGRSSKGRCPVCGFESRVHLRSVLSGFQTLLCFADKKRAPAAKPVIRSAG